MKKNRLNSALLVLFTLIYMTSCSSYRVKQTDIKFPTYNQWLDLLPHEREILDNYIYKDGYIEKKYKVLKKIKFNRNGRKKIAKIHFNR
jgi:hypothetical protein